MTKIEWTEETWNPVTGCTRISEGCTRCYIERTPPMRMAHRRFDGPQIGATTGVQLHPERVDQPLHWRRPRRVFVNSMSDLFHEAVPEVLIARVWATMALAPQHTFQVLTKRPQRMRSFLSRPDLRELVADSASLIHDGNGGDSANDWVRSNAPWPLPNVWLGVSVETQVWADIRIPQLLDTPAAVRWISAEPLLGPVELSAWMPGACTCKPLVPLPPVEGIHLSGCPALRWSGLDWVVVGGETGPGARPMHRDWARSLRDQCRVSGVPFFFKQWGNWAPESLCLHSTSAPAAFLSTAGELRPLIDGKPAAPPMARDGDTTVRRVGKKAAGRELDRREWNEYPAVRS